MTENVWKLLSMARNYLYVFKYMEMAKNPWKWLAWLEMDGTVGNGCKGLELA